METPSLTTDESFSMFEEQKGTEAKASFINLMKNASDFCDIRMLMLLLLKRYGEKELTASIQDACIIEGVIRELFKMDLSDFLTDVTPERFLKSKLWWAIQERIKEERKERPEVFMYFK